MLSRRERSRAILGAVGAALSRRCGVRIAVLLAVAMMAVGLASARAQQWDTISYTVTIGSVTLDLGQEGQVELRIVDIGGGAGAWTIDVTYDPDIVSVVECAAAGNSVCDADRTPNSLRVTGASATGLVEDTTLATITFRCAEAGTGPLSLSLLVFGVGFTVLEVDLLDGAITCKALRGDVNADGEVNSIDAFHLLQFNAGIIELLPDQLPVPEDWYKPGDVNDNGVLDAQDALLILQFHARLIDEL